MAFVEHVKPLGTVIRGTASGYSIFKYGEDDWRVVDTSVPAPNGTPLINGWYYVSILSPFKNYQQVAEHMNKNTKYKITSEMIENIKEVSSYQTDPSSGAFLSGLVTGGLALGAAKVLNSVSSSSNLAVYFKNGDKMLIQFNSIPLAGIFKAEMFPFDF